MNQNIPKIAVMLATYNGEIFIDEQLVSIFRQKNVLIDLYISDDGSSDQTINKIKSHIKKNPHNKIRLFKGPGEGFAKNFFSIFNKINQDYDYYCFSDQDDVWNQNKIQQSIKALNTFKSNEYNLYFSRTMMIDVNGNKIGASKNFKRKPSFQNALVQSIGGGNTCVFNKNSFDLILKHTKNYNLDYVSHDWLIYILITAMRGNVFFDRFFLNINYRQHSNNLIGSNITFLGRFRRLYDVFIKKSLQDWNSKHINFLETVPIHPKNYATYAHFKKCRDANLITRIYSYYKSGIYRQTKLTSFILFVSILLRRF